MDAVTIRRLYEYDRWANARTLGATSKLASEQFLKDLGSSHAEPVATDLIVFFREQQNR